MNDYILQNLTKIYKNAPELIESAIDLAVLGYQEALTEATILAIATEEMLDLNEVSIDDLYPEDIEKIERETSEYYAKLVRHFDMSLEKVVVSNNRVSGVFDQLSLDFPDLFG